jgi:hypothetical protein
VPTTNADKGLERNPLKITRAWHKISQNTIRYSALMKKSHSNVSNVRSACFILRRLYYPLNIDSIKLIYLTHFHSRVNYGIMFGVLLLIYTSFF